MIPISTSLADVMAKAVAFDTRDLRFESHHLQGFFEHFLLPTELYSFEQKKIKAKSPVLDQQIKTTKTLSEHFGLGVAFTLVLFTQYTSSFY